MARNMGLKIPDVVDGVRILLTEGRVLRCGRQCWLKYIKQIYSLLRRDLPEVVQPIEQDGTPMEFDGTILKHNGLELKSKSSPSRVIPSC